MKTAPAFGWGIRVNGPSPYLGYEFHYHKEDAETACTERYHKAIRIVMLPENEYHRLRKLDKNV